MVDDMSVCMLNDTLKEIVYRRKHQALFKKLVERTHFNDKEVQALAIIHHKITQVRGPLSRTVLRDILHAGLDWTENIRHLLIDRLFAVFDKNNALQIHLEGWIESLSVFLKGDLEEKIHFAYKIYDIMRNNRLKKEHIFPTMRGCLIKMQADEDPDDAVKDLIELTLKKLDVDRDGSISEEDFKTVVLKQPLLLEFMAPIFPSRDARYTFLTTFTDSLGRY